MMYTIYALILLSFAILVLISKRSRSGIVKVICFGVFLLECILIIANMFLSFWN